MSERERAKIDQSRSNPRHRATGGPMDMRFARATRQADGGQRPEHGRAARRRRRVMLRRGAVEAVAAAPPRRRPRYLRRPAPALLPPRPLPRRMRPVIPIKSPMLGTFYAAPKPGEKPFVTVGSRGRRGNRRLHHRSDEGLQQSSRPSAAAPSPASWPKTAAVEFGTVLFPGETEIRFESGFRIQ